MLVNSDSSPNYIQFNSLYQRLNTARWKARLIRSSQTNLSNLQTRINHSIVVHDFQYPFNLIGNDSTQLIAVTHQFEAWNDQRKGTIGNRSKRSKTDQKQGHNHYLTIRGKDN